LALRSTEGYPEEVLGGFSTPSFSFLCLKLDIILLEQKLVVIVVYYTTGVNYSNALPVKIVGRVFMVESFKADKLSEGWSQFHFGR